jgi:hypothetical protein
VLGTLHTSSAHKTVDRIIDVFPDAQQAQVRVQLAESLRGVIAQTLLPRHDGSGRVAAYEIMPNTRSISNLIREGKTFQIPSAMQLQRGAGCVTMTSSLEALLNRGVIARDQANELLGNGTATSGPAPAHSVATPVATSAPSAKATEEREVTRTNSEASTAPHASTGLPRPGAGTTGFSALANRLKKTS